MPNYEIIRYKQGMSANIVIHSVNRIKLHWHQEMELLLVLKGCVTLNINGKSYELKENDIFLVNCNDIHSTMANGDNILTAIQINPDFCHGTFPELKDRRINCASIGKKEDEEPVFAQIRTCIARMIVEYNKSGDGYQLAVEGILNTMLALIVRNLPSEGGNGAEKASNARDLLRIKRIMDFVQEHYAEKITLEDIANSEYLSVFYISHFFKEKVGLSFQRYLNYVRLHMAVTQLEETDKLISDIAMDTGFAGVKAFNKVFSDFYNQTPGEYRRKRAGGISMLGEGAAYMEFDSIKAMEKLQKYLDLPYSAAVLPARSSLKNLVVSLEVQTKPLNHYWQRLMTVGRCYDCLRADLQQQIKTAAQEIKFDFVRFHGVFSDEMRIMTGSDPIYCWQHVDKVLDFFVAAKLCPFFDLTFMPTEIASTNSTIFWYKGNISMPKSLELWTDLVENFIRHIINRYGQAEVRRWYFEIWNEPDYIWGGTQQQYFDFFAATTRTILKLDPELKIAGPSILQPLNGDTCWLDNMVDFLNTEDILLPYFTYHFYGEKALQGGDSNELVPILGEANYMEECVELYAKSIQRLKNPVKEVHITEFNISAFHGNYLLDTMFTACYILHTAINNLGKLDSLGFWTVSDIFEEDAHIRPSFNGGFGMMTAEAIKKPSYYAYKFLSLLGDRLIYKDENMIVTRRGENFQVLCYNFVFYDKMFISGDRSMLTFHNRYEVFEEKPQIDFNLQLQGLKGQYRIEKQMLDRNHGSAFDCYLKMGAPKELTAEDAEYLRGVGVPSKAISTQDIDGIYDEKLSLPPHGIVLLTLEKQS